MTYNLLDRNIVLSLAVGFLVAACGSDENVVLVPNGEAITDGDGFPDSENIPVGEVIPGNTNCQMRESGSIQVLETVFNAGNTTFESFRLSESGRLSRAIWDDVNVNNELRVVSDTVELGSGAYTIATEILLSMESAIPEVVDGISGSPAVNVLNVAQVNVSDPNIFITRIDAPSQSADALLEQWRSETTLRVPSPGQYMWTMFAKDDSRTPHLILSSSCDEDITRVMNDAILGDEVIVTASSEVSSIGGLATRPANFANQIPESMLFGFLSVSEDSNEEQPSEGSLVISDQAALVEYMNGSEYISEKPSATNLGENGPIAVHQLIRFANGRIQWAVGGLAIPVSYEYLDTNLMSVTDEFANATYEIPIDPANGTIVWWTGEIFTRSQ